MDIEKLALDYLNTTIVSEAKRKNNKTFKTRKAMINAYEKTREKYLHVKKIVDGLRQDGLALQKKFDEQKEKLDEYKQELLNIRNELNKMDGLEEAKKEETEEETEEETDEDSGLELSEETQSI